MWGGAGRTMPDSSVSSPEPSAGECRHQALLPPMLGRLAAGAALLAVLGMTLPAIAQNAKIGPHEAATSRPHVYLMRGLLNIFSLGMDQLAARIQSRGIDASVYNHSVADDVVSRIVQEYRTGDHGPYILIGHSLGADAVMTIMSTCRATPASIISPSTNRRGCRR
jgi:hypothetical protein